MVPTIETENVTIYFNGEEIFEGVRTRSDKSEEFIITIVADEGYSFNPDNDETPILIPRNLSVYVANMGTYYLGDVDYTVSEDFTTVSFDAKGSGIDDWLTGWGASIRFRPAQFKPTLAGEPSPITHDLILNLENISTNFDGVSEIEEGQQTIIFTADEGYTLDGVKLQYFNNFWRSDISLSGTEFEFEFDVSGEIRFNGAGVELPPSIPLVLDLTNMTASLENGTRLEDGDIEITFTADEGYTLENIPMRYNRPNGSTGFHYLTGLIDSKTFQINTTYMNNLTLKAVATEYVEPEITTEIVEVFEAIPFDTEEVDDPDLYIGETEISEGVEGELKITYLVTYHDGVEVERVEQNRERVKEPINKIVSRGTKPLPPETIPLNLNLQNMTASLDGGTLLEDGDVEITFIADSGYTLDGAIISFNRPNGSIGEERISDSDNVLTFTVNTSFMNSLNISGSANPKTKQISTFNNVYHVSSEDLTELSGVRFVSTSTGDIVDYGAYITKLFLLPFEIPSDIVAGTGAIQLGMFNSNVETTVLNDYQFKVNLGEITVPEKYHNVYDYLQTRCFVYLPFTNRIEIESSYIIDCTIHIEYVVNLYNGESTINIYSSKTDEPIHSETVTVVNDIPFMQTTSGNTISETQTVYNNGILKPFIIVERNIPYDEIDSVFGGEVVENGILNQFNGYVEVSDLKMTSKATSQEKSEIQTLLRNGVFING